MSEEIKDILRVSLDELSAVETESLSLQPTEQNSGAKSYGSIHEPAAPEITAQEKGSLFF